MNSKNKQTRDADNYVAMLDLNCKLIRLRKVYHANSIYIASEERNFSNLDVSNS